MKIITSQALADLVVGFSIGVAIGCADQLKQEEKFVLLSSSICIMAWAGAAIYSLSLMTAQGRTAWMNLGVSAAVGYTLTGGSLFNALEDNFRSKIDYIMR